MTDLAEYYPFVLNMGCSSVGYFHRRPRNIAPVTLKSFLSGNKR